MMQVKCFKQNDHVFVQGEPASFFGVLLMGRLVPMVAEVVIGAPRSLGEVIGEMALFEGGVRNANLVAEDDGWLAVIKFDQLERLKRSDATLHERVSTKLAQARRRPRAALAPRARRAEGPPPRARPHHHPHPPAPPPHRTLPPPTRRPPPPAHRRRRSRSGSRRRLTPAT